MLRFAAVALVGAAVLAITSPARGQTGVKDSVVGSGTAGEADGFRFVFEIDARSGPSGENTTGQITWNFLTGQTWFEGPVTCLAVDGNVAKINVRSPEGQIVSQEITDNSATGSADVIRTWP